METLKTLEQFEIDIKHSIDIVERLIQCNQFDESEELSQEIIDKVIQRSYLVMSEQNEDVMKEAAHLCVYTEQQLKQLLTKMSNRQAMSLCSTQTLQ